MLPTDRLNSSPLSTHLVALDAMRIGLAPALHLGASGHDTTAVQPSTCRPVVLDGVSACRHWIFWHPSRRPALSRVRTCRRVRRHPGACLRAHVRVDPCTYVKRDGRLDGSSIHAGLRRPALMDGRGRLDGQPIAALLELRP